MRNKIIFYILIISFTALLPLALLGGGQKSYAYETEYELNTNIVTPSSYLEFCELDRPVDVAVGDGLFVIAEAERLIVFSEGKYRYFDLTGYSISKIALFSNYCLFLSGSKISWLDITSDGEDIHPTDIIVSNYFFLLDDVLVSNPSTSVYRYKVTVGEFGPEFGELTTRSGIVGDALNVTVTPDGTIYYYSKGKFCSLRIGDPGTGEELTSPIAAVKYTATDGTRLYFTNGDGVYFVSLSDGGVTQLLTVSPDEKMFSLSDPQGIALLGNYLYIADAGTDSVYQYDIIKGAVTDLAISYRGDADNRIATALDIATDGSCVYTLETSAVKVLDTSNGSRRSFSLEGFSGASRIAATGNYLFLADRSNLYVVRMNGNTLEKQTLETEVGGITEYKNIECVTAYENAFYFLNNELNDTVTAAIYRLDISEMRISLVTRISGSGNLITSDIFGNIYVAVYASGVYDYYKVDPDADDESPDLIASHTVKPLDICCDIDSNIFILADDDRLISLLTDDDGNVTEQEHGIILSENLPSETKVKAISLVRGTDKTYLLTDRCLLKADKNSVFSKQIKVLTQIRIPVDYSVKTQLNPSVAKVKSGAKLFYVNLPALNDDGSTDATYFDYTNFGAKNDDSEYVCLAESQRFYLIANAYATALVRKNDVEIESAPIEDVSIKKYAVFDYGVYKYPVIDDYFVCGSIKANDETEVFGKTTFNGVTFALVNIDGDVGYIPMTLLKDDVSDASSPLSYYTVKIKKGGATVYSDADLSNAIGFFDGEVTVYALGEENGVITVFFGDGTGYVSAKDVKPSTYYALRNILIVVLLFIGLTATVVFIFRRKVFRKEKG